MENKPKCEIDVYGNKKQSVERDTFGIVMINFWGLFIVKMDLLLSITMDTKSGGFMVIDID